MTWWRVTFLWDGPRIEGYEAMIHTAVDLVFTDSEEKARAHTAIHPHLRRIISVWRYPRHARP